MCAECKGDVTSMPGDHVLDADYQMPSWYTRLALTSHSASRHHITPHTLLDEVDSGGQSVCAGGLNRVVWLIG